MNRMSSNNGEITHVSDTALMVAACRAHETELEDPFFRDPFAARLAGEHRLVILRALPHSNVVWLGLAARTRFVDELLLEGWSGPVWPRNGRGHCWWLETSRRPVISNGYTP
jgi:O-methyltransferase involved in polyketide biosynthesis